MREGSGVEASNKADLWTIAGDILQDQPLNLLLRSCRGTTVTGNSFASAFDCSIVLDKCRHIVIGSNIFDHNSGYQEGRIDGIKIRESSAVSLSDLILESTRAGDADSGGAIDVVDSSEVSITASQVLDPVHRGINLENVRNSRVSDCNVIDRRSEPSMRESIRLKGRGPGNLILNNLIGGAVGEPLAIADGATVVGNVVVEKD